LVGRTFESLKDALGLDDDRVGVLRDSLLDIVAGFQKSNGTDNPGTLFNAVNANKKIQAVVAPLLQPGGPLSVQGLAPKPAVDEEMVKKYESTKKDKDSLKKEKKKLEKEKKELEKKNAALNQELATIGGKQMQLATSNIEMEEKLLKVKKVFWPVFPNQARTKFLRQISQKTYIQKKMLPEFFPVAWYGGWVWHVRCYEPVGLLYIYLDNKHTF